jgi:hypothetical protein
VRAPRDPNADADLPFGTYGERWAPCSRKSGRQMSEREALDLAAAAINEIIASEEN